MLSHTAVHVQWIKHLTVNGSYVNEEGEPYLQVVSFEPDRKGDQNEALSADLLLTNVSMDDAGWYTCHLKNSYGTNFRSGLVTVLPGRQRHDTKMQCSSWKLMLTWRWSKHFVLCRRKCL